MIIWRSVEWWFAAEDRKMCPDRNLSGNEPTTPS